ncbi:dihydropteroate synthase [Pseudonocardia sp. GCM10023141]|uniref:dihydropteroate synthase n=1 Tax=Pseudonocardia sp. GCM10023141 TaxID=3252653 RepID=UPI0036181E23
MGILNVTPDSFSDGGRYSSTTAAVEHGLAMAADGADVIDVGGESTRPGAIRIPVDTELARVLPVVRDLSRCGVTVSIDTTRAVVADAAARAGAAMVNDVSGGLADPAMAKCIAAAGLSYVAMHWRAPSRTMAQHALYRDVVADVVGELGARVEALVDAGVKPNQIILDPGLGFAKTAAHNWQLLSRLAELVALGYPVLLGASRKSFLGELLGGATPVPPAARDAATVAASALAAAAGAFCVRVHDVASSLDAVRVADAWTAASAPNHR